jgi:DNA modification methylase
VLNRKGSKEQGDERHICPLQLDVIERALRLWSAPSDLVYSPFTGIGSEAYQSVKMGRRFVGSELKASYFKDACLWSKMAESEQDLFALK